MRRLGFTALVVAITAAVLVPAAHAAPYDLTFSSCLRSSTEPTTLGAATCTTDAGLRALDVVVSPDGRFVYVVGYRTVGGSATDGRLIVFARASDGTLTWQSCLSDTGGAGCGVTPIPALRGADSVAVSPDGASLYVGARGTGADAHRGALLRFRTAKPESIGYEGCIGIGTADGCEGGKAATALRSPLDVAVAPTGDRVAVGTSGTAVATYRREPDGSLSFNDCVGLGVPGCTSIMVASVQAVAFSGDGRDLYAAGGFVGTSRITHLVRNDAGVYEVTDCVADFAGMCRTTTTHIRDPTGITVSPDDGQVFVATNTGFLTTFLRGPAGNLSEYGCISNDSTDGCDPPGPRRFMGFLTDVAASPDNTAAYAPTAASLFTYVRRGGGTPFVAACDAPISPGYCEIPVATKGAVALSPDGASLYQTIDVNAGFEGSYLLTFRRGDRGPRPEDTSLPPGVIPPVVKGP